MPKSNEEMLDELHKAALVVQDLTDNGGILLPEQANQFVLIAQEQQVILPDARVEIVARGQKEIDRLGLNDVFLQPGTEDNTTLYTDPTTYLAGESKPVTDKIPLSVVKVEGRAAVSRETIRRNIEKENFPDTLIGIIGNRAGFDLELLGVSGDVTNANTTREEKLLHLKDGYLKKVPAANKVYWGGENFSPYVFLHVINKVALKYRRKMTECVIYVSAGVMLGFQAWLIKNKNTPLADQATQDGNVVRFGGAAIKACDSLRDRVVGGKLYGRIMFTNPKNLIWAIEDQIEIEDEIVKARNSMIIYFRAYVDPTVEEVNALASCEDVALTLEGS